MDTHLANMISSASFADDLSSETNIIQDLKMTSPLTYFVL